MEKVVKLLKSKYAVNEPISVSDIRSTLSNYTIGRVYQIIADLESQGQLKRFKQGTYYIPEKTIFGDSILDPRKVIVKKYISDGENSYGYFTGITLLNAFGLSTQSANVLEIRTNKESTNNRRVTIGAQQVIIKKSRVKLNNENCAAITILELFNLLDTKDIPSKDFSQVIAYAKSKELTSEKIFKFARNMPAKATKNFITSEVANALT